MLLLSFNLTKCGREHKATALVVVGAHVNNSYSRNPQYCSIFANLIPTCGVSRASQRNALLIQHCYSPYRTTQFEKTIKKRQKGPVLAIKGPFGDLGGPRRALGGQIWSQRPPIGQSGLESCSPHTLTWYGAPSGSLGALKETVLARNAPFGGPRGPRRAPGGQI